MFGYNPTARGKQLFEAQFEPRGDGYVYRKSLKGPPIPVTSEERQRFIDDYNRRSRYSMRGMFATWILLIILFIAWDLETGAELSNTAFFLAIAAAGIGFIAGGYWTWSAPARELERRTPIGHERSNAEMRRAVLKTKSYAHIFGVAAVAALGCLRFAEEDNYSGWGRLWLGLGAIVVVLFAIQAFMKWRADTN